MLLILTTAWETIFAQSPDTISLKSVEVMGSRASLFTGGVATVLSDSSQQNAFNNQSLSELLSSGSAVFIKSYGSGGSATISSRGTEARHNAVLWNGFSINSATLGLTDVSMIPSAMSDNITLYHGGSSPVNGNAALGSMVLLENGISSFTKNNTTKLVAEKGSFGNTHGTLTSEWSNKFAHSKTVLFYDAAKNDFNYINFTHRDKPTVKQQHAAYTNYGLVQDFQFKVNENNFFTAGIWFQFTERELPALMTTMSSVANQRDSTWRTYAGYKLIWKNSVVNIKGAWFREFQFYNDEKYSFNNRYVFNNYFGEVEWRYFAGNKWIINSGIILNKGSAAFKEYSEKRERNTTAIFSDVRYKINLLWQVSLNLRQEFSNIANPPFSPSLSIEGVLYKKILTVLARAGRNYSLPSMNDLYWIPGGNPSLKPEDAWSEEVSLVFFKAHAKLPSLNFTIFNSVVNNWIKWQPGPAGIYEPDNLRKVHARGIEASMNYNIQYKNWNFKTGIQYAWCRSEVSQTFNGSENVTVGKQLIYVPEHMMSTTLSASWKTFLVYLTNSYTGERYTSSDNSSKLNGYHLTNISVEKSFPNTFTPLNIYIKVMNLFDTTYQVLAYRPMPGRWLSAGIKINFQKPTKSIKTKS